MGDNDAVKLLVSDGFVLDSLFDEAGADNLAGTYGSAPTLLTRTTSADAGKTFLDAYRGRSTASRRSTRPTQPRPRRRSWTQSAARRLLARCRREAVRGQPHRQHVGDDGVQRGR